MFGCSNMHQAQQGIKHNVINVDFYGIFCGLIVKLVFKNVHFKRRYTCLSVKGKHPSDVPVGKFYTLITQQKNCHNII